MKSSILVVDDEAAVTLALEIFFASKGYEVLRAFYGDQAIKQIEAKRPTIAILDLQMPGVNGVAVLEKMRKDFPEIKALVITGYSDRYSKDLERLKPEGILLKPVSLEELTRAVEELLGTHKKAAPKSAPAAEIRVLFIEGSADLHDKLRRHFESADRRLRYQTAFAKNGQETLRQLNEFHPHLVLVDGTRMPIGMEAGRIAADASKTAQPPLEVILHSLKLPLQDADLQLDRLDEKIFKVAEYHRLISTEGKRRAS